MGPAKEADAPLDRGHDHGVVDPLRFPTLSTYLSQLPAELESYPECQTKGSMIRSAIEGHDLEADLDGLPETLAKLVTDPPPPTRWVPLVYGDAIFHAVCDRFYRTEDEVVEWTYRRTLAMAKSKMYQKLVQVAGPGFLLKVSTKVHGVFEKGTRASAEVEGNNARIELSHPPNVHSRLNHYSNVGMLRGIVDLTGGTNPRCAMRHSKPEGAVFECQWD
jgi:hypothetical protein